VPIYGIALHNQFFAWGTVNQTVVQYADQALGSAGAGAWGGTADEALAVAFDSTGNLYYGNADNSVWFVNFSLGLTTFETLSFTPAGMVVDSTRGRVYISNQQGNAIEVYSTTTGALLKTIQ
jgi:hypothetical protein